ncbi:MAG: NAD+ synthase [Myxococcales bacterium]|nr:NAD+ synthase [Myxococcales bacterium]
MRVALCQINPTVGDITGNAELMIDACRQAVEQGAQLAVFPELVLPGYPPLDLLERNTFLHACHEAEQSFITQIPNSLTVVFGNIHTPITSTNGNNQPQNVAVVAKRRNILQRVAKTLLPTYDIFDEARYFSPRQPLTAEPAVLHLDGHIVGITLCEDIWGDPKLRLEAPKSFAENMPCSYSIDPVEALIQQGANTIINLSASPWSHDKLSIREHIIRHVARRCQAHTIYVNSVGANDGLVFDGHSLIASPDGQLMFRAVGWRPSVHTIDLRAPSGEIRPTYEPTTEILEALTLGVGDYFRKTGIKKAVIGLSGGIDSAVTCAIAVRALGKEQVIGVGMPSKFSSVHSINDARSLAENLQIPFHLLPIQGSVDAIETLLTPIFGDRPRDITEENLQSRVRGLTLMAIANKFGAAVLGTGNKSEIAMGYATLYGDTIGALSVLADLYKHQVYAIAQTINADRQVIPQNTINKAPSAELRPDQKDTDSLPSYEILDTVLQQFIERKMSVSEISAVTGIELTLVEKIVRMVYANEFKRKQLPPTIRVCPKAWVGRVYPIAQRFRT